MGITVGHDPSMGSLLNMSYLAGLGNFNRWQAEYQQRSDLANAQMATQGNLATAGHVTQGNLGQESMYGRMYQNQYNNDMRQQLAVLRADLAGRNQLRNTGARLDGTNPIVTTGDQNTAGMPAAPAGAGANPYGPQQASLTTAPAGDSGGPVDTNYSPF